MDAEERVQQVYSCVRDLNVAMRDARVAGFTVRIDIVSGSAVTVNVFKPILPPVLPVAIKERT